MGSYDPKWRKWRKKIDRISSGEMEKWRKKVEKMKKWREKWRNGENWSKLAFLSGEKNRNISIKVEKIIYRILRLIPVLIKYINSNSNTVLL